jgi:hypothetical protein
LAWLGWARQGKVFFNNLKGTFFMGMTVKRPEKITTYTCDNCGKVHRQKSNTIHSSRRIGWYFVGRKVESGRFELKTGVGPRFVENVLCPECVKKAVIFIEK